MDRNRALEIVAAYGGDASRWPDEERDAALAAVAADRSLGRARDEAAALDTLMAAWAQGDGTVATDASRAADAALARLPRLRRWLPAGLIGGSLAAGLAAAVLLLSPAADVSAPPTTQIAAQTAEQAQATADATMLATVFTLTPEEETLI